MKKTIYTLAFLPFIAFSIKTIANEEDASYAAQKRGALNLVADATGNPQMPSQDMEMMIRQALPPDYQALYDQMSAEDKKSVIDAAQAAPPGQKIQAAKDQIDTITAKEKGVIFDNSGAPTPASTAASSMKTPSSSPAMNASMNQPDVDDSPAQTAAQAGDKNW